MRLSAKSVKLLAALLPAGVFAMSTALASTSPTKEPDPTARDKDVASRLAAIRDAVSNVTDEGYAEDPTAKDKNKDGMRTAWWGNRWGNGWRRGWGWRPGWHNGGWGNGGWRNWHNGWHNWGNW